MEDINYGELFGIEETQDAKEPEIVEPASEEQSRGEEAQELAEPVVTDEPQSDGGDGKETSESDENSDAKPTQSPEERSKYAAARRKAEAERDEAVAKAREEAAQEAQRVIDEAFKNSGLKNPYTNTPINSKAEYDEYKARFEQEKKDRVIQKSGMTDEEFSEFVDSLPQVKQAKAAALHAEQVQREAVQAKEKAEIDEQLRQIGEMNPAIKSVEDLTKMDNYTDFYNYVRRGNNFVDAYKLANFDALTNKAVSSAKQAAMNLLNGKEHMEQTSSRGSGAVTVPADVALEYRVFNPDATDAEISRHYNKYLKGR